MCPKMGIRLSRLSVCILFLRDLDRWQAGGVFRGKLLHFAIRKLIASLCRKKFNEPV